LHILFPSVRAEILRCLFFDPSRECYVRELARTTTLSLRTVQQELARLSEAGLVKSRSNGYYRFYRANRAHAVFRELHQLVIKDESPRPFVSKRKRPRLSWRKRRPARLRKPFRMSMGFRSPG
jgi:DNA-binding transcriptional ArsR family regulator